MPPALTLASLLVDEAIAAGVRDLVLCPGSRSGPLAYAALAAADAGRLRLHVRVDERSAAFLALGLGKLTRRPAVLVTTSGTAVANCHPAVLEAHHARVPLVVVSADRPAELRGTGANQTTRQPGMFGFAVAWETDLAAPTSHGDATAHAGAMTQAVLVSRGMSADGRRVGDPGPVHVNVGLREPLVPERWPMLQTREGADLPQAAGVGSRGPTRPGSTPGVGAPEQGTSRRPEPIDEVARTLVVLGDLVDPSSRPQVSAWARARGYPLIAEPFGLRADDSALAHGSLLLHATDWLAAHEPDRVLVVGRPTLSRAVTALLRRPGLEVEAISDSAEAPDPVRVVRRVHPFAALAAAGHSPPTGGGSWLAEWRRAEAVMVAAVREEAAASVSVQGQAPMTGLTVARTLASELPVGATLFAGSSNPARQLDLATPTWRDGVTVVANRGLAGIDGCLATAIGIGLTRPSTYALVGDLTFVHDSNALAIGSDEGRPDLTIVVVNDDGGGIFTLLEPGAAERAAAFERIFGTPTGTDLRQLCAAHGVEHRLANSEDLLAAEVAAPQRGIRVVEVPVDRSHHRDAHARLVAACAAAVREY